MNIKTTQIEYTRKYNIIAQEIDKNGDRDASKGKDDSSKHGKLEIFLFTNTLHTMYKFLPSRCSYLLVNICFVCHIVNFIS